MFKKFKYVKTADLVTDRKGFFLGMKGKNHEVLEMDQIDEVTSDMVEEFDFLVKALEDQSDLVRNKNLVMDFANKFELTFKYFNSEKIVYEDE